MPLRITLNGTDSAGEQKKATYECHFPFQPLIRPSIRLESQNDRLVAQPTNPTEDLDWDESGQLGSRLLGLCDADHH